MAEHNVSFALPEFDMKRVDAHFIIKKDSVKLGEIRISKGGLDYYPGKKQYGVKLTWTQLDSLIRKYEAGEIKL
jgi:hypothetical protein